MNTDDYHGRLTKELLSIIPESEQHRVFEQEHCDIDPSFIGFIDIYKNLSEIIPKHFTIVDLGCAYAPQAYYFKDHKKYIGVDIFLGERFRADNTKHLQITIRDFCDVFASSFDKDETFAICNYVPPWHGDNREMARKYFENLFVYYPHGGYQPIVKKSVVMI